MCFIFKSFIISHSIISEITCEKRSLMLTSTILSNHSGFGYFLLGVDKEFVEGFTLIHFFIK